MKALHAFLIKTSRKRDKKILKLNFFVIHDFLSIFGFGEYKINYSPIWRVQNLFGEYEIEVTRHIGEYEFFLMSNPVILTFQTEYLFKYLVGLIYKMND